MTLDDETTSVAGKARWGELPVVAPVDSEEGSELLEGGWSATTEEFERDLERVRTAVEEFNPAPSLTIPSDGGRREICDEDVLKALLESAGNDIRLMPTIAFQPAVDDEH